MTLSASAGRPQRGVVLGKRTVIAALEKGIRSFKTVGEEAYLSCGNYDTMLERIAGKSDELVFREYDNGGRAIAWRSKEN